MRERISYGGDDDHLGGGEGKDKLFGGDGNDYLSGGVGESYLIGGDGDDFVSGLWGNDKLKGGSGDDIVDGYDGNDTLFGDDGNDHLRGGKGVDKIYGGSGNDIFELTDEGPDFDKIMDFKKGEDQIHIGVGFDFSQVAGFERGKHLEIYSNQEKSDLLAIVYNQNLDGGSLSEFIFRG